MKNSVLIFIKNDTLLNKYDGIISFDSSFRSYNVALKKLGLSSPLILPTGERVDDVILKHGLFIIIDERLRSVLSEDDLDVIIKLENICWHDFINTYTSWKDEDVPYNVIDTIFFRRHGYKPLRKLLDKIDRITPLERKYRLDRLGGRYMDIRHRIFILLSVSAVLYLILDNFIYTLLL